VFDGNRGLNLGDHDIEAIWRNEFAERLDDRGHVLLNDRNLDHGAISLGVARFEIRERAKLSKDGELGFGVALCLGLRQELHRMSAKGAHLFCQRDPHDDVIEGLGPSQNLRKVLGAVATQGGC
jgi:hypothetical protein